MLHIEPDHCCFSDLSWRLAADEGSSAAAIAMAAVEDGWIDRSRSELVREIHHPDGHVLVVGIATGRVQLRLSYLVPARDRRAAARALGAALGRLRARPASTVGRSQREASDSADAMTARTFATSSSRRFQP